MQCPSAVRPFLYRTIQHNNIMYIVIYPPYIALSLCYKTYIHQVHPPTYYYYTCTWNAKERAFYTISPAISNTLIILSNMLLLYYIPFYTDASCSYCAFLCRRSPLWRVYCACYFVSRRLLLFLDFAPCRTTTTSYRRRSPENWNSYI